MSVFDEWNQRESGSQPPKAAAGRNPFGASQPPTAVAPANPFARGGASGASPPRPTAAASGGGVSSGANPFARGSFNPKQPTQVTAAAQSPGALTVAGKAAAGSDEAGGERMFSLEPHPWQAAVGGCGVSYVAVGNSLMCLALPGCRILRWRATRCEPHVRLCWRGGGYAPQL
jgi:hypothetical protein